MAIPVIGMASFRAAHGERRSAPLLPTSYPYSTGYVTAPDGSRIFPLGNNQASDPRAGASYGGNSGVSESPRGPAFFPTPGQAGIDNSIPAPGNNLFGLSISNLIVLVAILGASYFLFRKK